VLSVGCWVLGVLRIPQVLGVSCVQDTAGVGC